MNRGRLEAHRPGQACQHHASQGHRQRTQSQVTKGIWFVFTLHILVMELTKPGLHTFPEDNLSLLTKQSSQRPAGKPELMWPDLRSPEQPVQCT